MTPRNPALDALAVEALRHVPELLATLTRLARAQETAAEASTFRALLAYAEAVGRPDEAADATSAAAVTIARANAVRGAAHLARRLIARAGSGLGDAPAAPEPADAPAPHGTRVTFTYPGTPAEARHAIDEVGAVVNCDDEADRCAHVLADALDAAELTSEPAP